MAFLFFLFFLKAQTILEDLPRERKHQIFKLQEQRRVKGGFFSWLLDSLLDWLVFFFY